MSAAVALDVLAQLGLRIRPMRDEDLRFVCGQPLRFQLPRAMDRSKLGCRRFAAASIAMGCAVVLCSAEHEATIEGWALAGARYLRPTYYRHDPSVARELFARLAAAMKGPA